MKEKKSQAAFEFLITYGWAILGVMIVLAGLAYFGFFNTEKFVNDDCSFGDQLRCEDYILTGNSAVLNFTLRNNFGVNIDITKSTISSDYGNDIVCSSSPNLNISAGRLFNVSCGLYSSSILASEKVRAKAIVTFKKNGGANPEHNLTGTIIVTAQ